MSGVPSNVIQMSERMKGYLVGGATCLVKITLKVFKVISSPNIHKVVSIRVLVEPPAPSQFPSIPGGGGTQYPSLYPFRYPDLGIV